MSWSDWLFIPSGSQTSEEQAANYARQQEEYRRKLQARQSTDQSTWTWSPLEDQDAAAWAGFKEGAAEGFNNVLDAPGKAVAMVTDAAGQTLWGVLKSIPWWIWLAAIGYMLFRLGGLKWLEKKFRLS